MSNRIIPHIGISIEVLWFRRVWYNRIGREETVRRGHIEPRIHIRQPNVSVLIMSGKASFCDRCVGGRPLFTKRQVPLRICLLYTSPSPRDA